jgi:hypothetical protein
MRRIAASNGNNQHRQITTYAVTTNRSKSYIIHRLPTGRQAQHRKTYQATVEKHFKTKQAQEAHVNKARKKYEQECLLINSYSAQSTLVQGKDLERISVKLERAQQTAHANKCEHANLARGLQESVGKWEQEWRQFCDSCQDLEEERMDFAKDNVWAYTNAVSIVCVSDDEVRLSTALNYHGIRSDGDPRCSWSPVLRTVASGP